MKIEVLWEDLVEGDTGIPSRCAIARAINRAYPHYTNVTVGEQSIRMNDKRKRTRYAWPTPAAARHFIKRFDRGEPLEPGLTFDLFEHLAIKQTIPESKPGASRAARAPKAVVKSQVLEGASSGAAAETPADKKARVARRRWS